MTAKPVKHVKTCINDVLAMISRFEMGDFSKPLSSTDDPKLKPLVDGLNRAAKHLASQATSTNEKSEIRYRTAFDISPIGMITLNRKCEYLSANDAYCKLLGYSREELLKMTIFDVTHPEDLAATQRKALEIEPGLEVCGFEKRFITKSGTALWCRVSSRVVLAPHTQELEIHSYIEDVSAAHRAQEIIERKSSLIEALINSHSAAVFALDLNQKFILANDEMVATSGLSREQLIGKGIYDFWPKEKAEELSAINEQVLKTGKPITVEESIERISDHSQRCRVTSKFPIKDNAGNVVGLAGVAVDITELEKAKRQLALSLAETHRLKAVNENIIKALPVGIAILDSGYRFKAVNPALEKILGYTTAELMNLSMTDITHPDDVDASTDAAKKALYSNDVIQHEKRYFHKSGKIVWARITAATLHTSADKNNEIAGIIEDITDKKFAELSNSSKIYGMQKLLDGIPALVSHWDINLKNLSANRGYLERFGKTPDEILGQHYKSVIGENLFLVAESYMKKALAGQSVTFVQEILRPDGSKSYINVNYYPDHEDGRINGFFTVAIDVTEQKMGELERDRLSALLEVVLQNVPSMIFVKDYKNNLRFSLFNRAGEKLLGLKKDQLIGKNDYDLFPKEQADFFTSKDREVFSNGDILKIQKEEIDTAHGKRLLQTYKVPTFDHIGEPHLLIGISNDITDEYKMKQDLELERTKSIRNSKLASLGQMSAGIAHEINNPLAIISGSAALLPKFIDNPEKLSAKIDTIEKACARISRIVIGLKKFSRSSERSNFAAHSLDDIVKEVLILTESTAKRHDTPISYDCQTKALISCDEVEIEQVLVNLINNSIDAVRTCSEKWVKVVLTEDKSMVTVRITDSGPGIPEDIRSNLFEPFFTTKKVGEGTGLGLSIAKGIIDEHNGVISIVTDCSHTCFEIKIPQAVGIQKSGPCPT